MVYNANQAYRIA
jgi:succinyl-CoA synthetase beta subunit